MARISSMWSFLFLGLFMVLSTNAFSKYGRSCKDIGCLNSETCIIVEEPCTYGRASNDCGSYPTCKKKTAADGETHNVPVTKPTTPKPIAELRPNIYDEVPNYPAPAPPAAPPRGSSFGSGGNNPYGGNTYGGGSNPYGGGSNPYGGSSNNHGSSSGGSSNPFSGFLNGLGGNTAGGSSGGGSNPFSGFLNGLGGNTAGSASNGQGGNPITSILSGFLSNFTKNLPALNPSFTRPGLIENNRNNQPNPYGQQPNPYGQQPNPYGQQPNPYGQQPNPYGQQPGYQQPASYYPSYSNPSQGQAGQPTQQNGYVAKNYGKNNAARNMASTTRRPVSSYGWNFGIAATIIFVTGLFVKNI